MNPSIFALLFTGTTILASEPAPLSPAESLRQIRLAPDFRAELAAAEPLIADPVAIDWDATGRLWVVEMADYPLGLDGKGQPGGRIRILEDTDGDGRYDRSTIFAEALSFPTGILTWRDGAIVTAAPEILFLEDSDNDGRADVREVLFSGFSEGNQQLRINGLRWGLDNWVYCAAGAHYRGYASATKIKSTRTGQEISLGSRDFRFKPDTGQFDPQSGPAQFGRNRDEWGRWFGTQNSNPLWHYVLPDHYLRRNPFVPSPDPTRQLFVPANPRVYPASSSEKRFHSFEHEGHFTSACSGMIYGDTLLFGPSATHAFVGEPFHNLVQHQILEPDGVSFKARRAPGEDRLDFFASSDRWSRPVMARTGPDGALWIVDMYRLIIEHPDWLPEPGRAELLPLYRKGDDRGRIYRILPDKPATPPFTSLASLPPGELISILASNNAWLRDKAQQMLIWRADKSIVPQLEDLARKSPNPLARLHALCTLNGLAALRSNLLLSALGDPEPGVRENAVRLAEMFDDDPILRAATALIEDRSPKVRLQLAFTLGDWESPIASEALARLAAKEHSDPFFVAAIMSSAPPHLEALGNMLSQPGETRARYLEPIVLTALGVRNTNFISRFTAPSLHDFGEYATLLKIANQRGIDPKMFGNASALIGSAEEKLRGASDSSAASVLIRNPSTRARAMEALAGWLTTSSAPELQATAIQLLGETGETNVPALLLKNWANHGPKTRGSVLQTLLRREAWILELLARIDPAAFDSATRAQVGQHSSRKVRDAAQRLFSAQSPRAEVIANFKPALSIHGNPQRGAEIYQQLCQTCHQRDGQGGDVGPSIHSVASHSSEKLLVNILDPNADIQPGYHAYTCILKNGEELYGVIASETATSIVFKLPNASAQTISRQDIAGLRASNFSLMPEGLENEMTPPELADLIAFIRGEKGER